MHTCVTMATMETMAPVIPQEHGVCFVSPSLSGWDLGGLSTQAKNQPKKPKPKEKVCVCVCVCVCVGGGGGREKQLLLHRHNPYDIIRDCGTEGKI